MRTVWSDLCYAARALRHSPGLVLVAAVSLGLGMSVNTALFSAVRALLFEHATVAAPDRLVRVWLGGASSVSYPNLRDLELSGILEARRPFPEPSPTASTCLNSISGQGELPCHSFEM
jgi:hypothetical protein